MAFWMNIFGLGSLGLVLMLLRMRYRNNGGFYRRNCRHIKTSMNGKTVVITGGNAGIGKETAIDFARRGARVIIGCRNPSKAEVAVKDIQRRSGSSNVVYHHLELSDQDSIRKFADTILKEEPKLAYLINNAGIGRAAKDHVTKEGYNIVFAINHFGHFLLTMLLLDRLKKNEPSRIINVSSVVHTWVKPGEMHFAQRDDEGRIYPALREYQRSKLANVLFTKELARRLDGTRVSVFAVHPGTIYTSIVNTSYEAMRESSARARIVYWLVTLVMILTGSNEESGAQTTIYCTLEESITHLSGGYFDNCCLTKESKLARDAGLAKKLWEVSCQATGFK